MRIIRTVRTMSAIVVLIAGAAIAVPTTNGASGGVIILTPGCTYVLTASHGDDGVHGPSGLPPIIITTITVEGNANVITRSGVAAFRILQVSTPGDLTLKAVTISNGG
jgi:hypothetical protein